MLAKEKEKRKEYIQVRELVYFGFDYRLAFSSEPVGGDDLWRMVISFSFFSLYTLNNFHLFFFFKPDALFTHLSFAILCHLPSLIVVIYDTRPLKLEVAFS